MTDLSRWHRAFTLDTPEADAIAQFVALYKVPPEHAVVDHGLLWVGPLPQEVAPCPTLPPLVSV